MYCTFSLSTLKFVIKIIMMYLRTVSSLLLISGPLIHFDIQYVSIAISLTFTVYLLLRYLNWKVKRNSGLTLSKAQINSLIWWQYAWIAKLNRYKLKKYFSCIVAVWFFVLNYEEPKYSSFTVQYLNYLKNRVRPLLRSTFQLEPSIHLEKGRNTVYC